MSRGNRGKGASNAKRLVIFGIIGALVASTFALVYSARFAEDKREETERQTEESFRLARCGDGIAKRTQYIQEFLLPSECSMPVGIAVDRQGNVWVVSSSNNKVMKYDPLSARYEEYDIPSNKVLKDMPFPVWATLFDESNRLWFTDAENNSIWLFDTSSKEFKQFKLQSSSEFGTSMPVDMKIHDGKVWFIGVYSKHIGMIDTSTLELKEIPIDVELQALGTLALDKQGNVWFTALTLGTEGRLYMLDPSTGKITTYDLPITSPVGISIDDSDGSIWINDHGSNMFIRFDPNTGKVERYVTPLPSRFTNLGLYDRCINDNGSPLTCGGYQVSLPYWNAIDSKGRLWFNEHQGNAIAVFDPKMLTLVEYHIPTHNKAWGSCENYTEQCGIANPLRFTLVDDNTVWFTEFSENKIARLDASKQLPYTLAAQDRYTIRKGESITIPLTINANNEASIEMVIASSESPEGKITNIKAEFSERVFNVQPNSTKVVNLRITALDGLKQGEYTLTIGARSSEVTYSKVVRLLVE